MSNLSATGALTAFGSGIMLGFGWALLNNDRFQDAKDVARTTIGGGFFVAGLYVWCEHACRHLFCGAAGLDPRVDGARVIRV